MTLTLSKSQIIITFTSRAFTSKTFVPSSLGGLDLSRRGLGRDSQSRCQKRVSLDGRENLRMSSIIIVEKHDCAGVNKNVRALHPNTFVPSLS